MEVIYTGLHQTPEQIVDAAIQEDADAIGLSVLSGAHMTLFARVLELLKERGASDIVVFGGGIIPDADIAGWTAGRGQDLHARRPHARDRRLGEVHARRPRRVRGAPPDQLAPGGNNQCRPQRCLATVGAAQRKGKPRENLDSNARARRAVCVHARFLASQSCPG